MNPNPEKTVPQNNLEGGSDYSMANAFEKLGGTPASFPKQITLDAANDPKKASYPRGGRGTKASSELTQLIKKTLEENKIKDRQLETELKKDEKLFDKEVERMEDVYTQFSEDLDTLKKRLAEETNHKERRRLQALMSQANNHLRVLRKIIPKEEVAGTQSEYDTEVFKSVAEKFKKYEEARRRQTIAEIDLNKKGGSIGKHEEARNEAIKLREEISSLIKQGELVIAQNSPHPAQDESIGNIRTEGAEVMNTVQPDTNPEDQLILAPEGSAPGSLELPKEEQVGGIEQGTTEPEDLRINTTVEALAEQATTSDSQEATNVFENEEGKTLDADIEHTQEEHNAGLPVLTEVVDETFGIPLEGQEGAFTKFETLADTPTLDLKPEQSEPIKPFDHNIADIDEETEAPSETPMQTVSAEELLGQPLLTDFAPPEQTAGVAAADTSLMSTPEQEPVVQSEIEDLQEEEVMPNEPTEALAEESTTTTMPKEFTPGNTAELARLETYGDKVFLDDMSALFGKKKGPWGIFGYINGIDSPHMKDPDSGFLGKTVNEILNAKPNTEAMSGTETFGTNNAEALKIMVGYINNIQRVSGTGLNTSEKLADFVRHAAIINATLTK